MGGGALQDLGPAVSDVLFFDDVHGPNGTIWLQGALAVGCFVDQFEFHGDLVFSDGVYHCVWHLLPAFLYELDLHWGF